MRVSAPGFLRAQSDGVLLSLKVHPRASRDEIGEPLGAELRVKVTAPPVESAANEAVIRLLAGALDIPRNRLALVRGGTSRHKIVKVLGLSEAQVLAKLAPA